MKNLSISLLNEKLRIAFKRFPITIALIGVVAGIFFWAVNESENDITFPFWVFFLVGTFLTATVSLWGERMKSCLNKLLITFGALLLLGVYCFFLPTEDLKDAQILQVVILGAVFFVSLLVVPFLKKDTDNEFWNFSVITISQFILAVLFSIVLFGGLALALFAIDSLFKIHIDDDSYGNLAVFCFSIFAPIYFLANIPYKEEKYIKELTLGKFSKVLGLYIILPLLALYTLILYIYLMVIVFTWELPEGMVSTLVSVLVGGGLLCMLLLYPHNKQGDNKVINFFSRYFGVIVLPLIVLMTIGIFRRISDYGLTVNRCYVLLINLWFYGICIYTFITKSKRIKWILLSFVAIAFIASIGPWSVFNITKQSLLSQLEKTFDQAGLLKDGQIHLSDFNESDNILKIDLEKAYKAEQSIVYLCKIFGSDVIQPLFRDVVSDMSSYEIIRKMNFPERYHSEELSYRFSYYMNQETPVMTIKDYNYCFFVEYSTYQGEESKIHYLYNDGVLSVENTIENKVISIPLLEKVMSLVKAESEHDYYSTFSREIMTIDGEGFQFYLNEISGNYYEHNDSIDISGVKGFLFYK